MNDMNNKYLEIIKTVMSSFGYNLTESIACNGSDEYIIMNNEVTFSIRCEQLKGKHIADTLQQKLQEAGAQVTTHESSDKIIYTYKVEIIN